MVEKKLISNNNLSAYYWVEEILSKHKGYCLTKEEILAQMPTDDNGVLLITVSSVENALRALCHARVIDADYYQGKRLFSIAEKREVSRYEVR